MLDTTNGSVRITTILRPGDTVEWCGTRYVVTEIYSPSEIWGRRLTDNFEFLIGLSDELTLIRS